MYTETGAEVDLLAETTVDGAVQYLVRDIYEHGPEEWAGDPRIAQRVFKEPPTRKLDESVQRLLKRHEEARANLSAMQEEVRDLCNRKRDLLAKYKDWPDLQRLFDFLDGKITHVVKISYGRAAIEEWPCMADEGWPEKIRLLYLFGDPKRHLEFALNSYSDGSGSNTTVIPCTSHEEACDTIKKYLEGLDTVSGSSLKSAKKFGATLKPEAVKAHHEQLRKNLERSIDEKEEALTGLRKKLAEVENG
jgi:hypothetical protein